MGKDIFAVPEFYTIIVQNIFPDFLGDGGGVMGARAASAPSPTRRLCAGVRRMRMGWLKR